MPDLSINFCGVKSPNPFWLASGRPPTPHTGDARLRCRLGGAVWKTIGEPIIIRHRATARSTTRRAHDRVEQHELISDRRWKITFADRGG